MARTRSPDYDKIQASILDRTAALFASRGYAATSIGDIATACECSKSRLYHYFGSKEAILSDMLTEHVDRLLEECRETLKVHDDPHKRFKELITYFMEVYAVSRDKHVVLLTCIEFLPPDKREEVINKERELVAYVQEALGHIRPDRARDQRSAHVDTMLFFGMINWTYTWYRASGPIASAELADRVIEIFLDGYRNATA
ncbi:MAG: TetR/AcrR family transcriptional regulator [Pseudomonadota bacterium]